MLGKTVKDTVQIVAASDMQSCSPSFKESVTAENARDFSLFWSEASSSFYYKVVHSSVIKHPALVWRFLRLPLLLRIQWGHQICLTWVQSSAEHSPSRFWVGNTLFELLNDDIVPTALIGGTRRIPSAQNQFVRIQRVPVVSWNSSFDQ